VAELELWVHDAWTGDEIGQVRQAAEESTKWATAIGGTGTCTWLVKVGPGDLEYRRADIDRLFTPNSRFLALRYGTVVLGAWKIDDWDYDEARGVVTVTGSELRGEAKWRMTYALSNVQAGDLTVTNRSYSGAVRAILARFMQWTSGWYYPIDLPADGAGSFTAAWKWWQKLTIEDLLKQVEDEGQEVLLRPYLTAGRQLRFQTIVAPAAVSGKSYFHLQAEDRPLSGVHYTLSGVDQVTGVQGLGSGTGQDQAYAVAGNMTFLIPARDVKITFNDLTGDRLQAATDTARDRMRDPVAQWSIDAFTFDDKYGPEHALTGRAWQIESKGDPVIPDETHQLRVISASGSWSHQIKVGVQDAA
jgi:hypothetical protein